MNAMTTKEPTGIAELALKFYEEVKGPMENRILVLKAIGIHQKDLNAAAAYLVTAADPIPCPTLQDLEDWTGVKSQTAAMDILSELQVTPREPDPYGADRCDPDDDLEEGGQNGSSSKGSANGGERYNGVGSSLPGRRTAGEFDGDGDRR